MRKTIIIAALLATMSSSAVYAHLTGAFADFLVSVHDENTTAKLKAEMERTKQDIEAIAPQAVSMERQFAANRSKAAEKLRLYADMGMDTWLGLMLQAEEPVELLAAHKVAERNVTAYIGQLDDLYKEFRRLAATQNSLEGHRRLLAMIEQNLNARQSFLKSSADVGLEQQANYLDIDWMSEVEPHLLRFLEHDREIAAAKLGEWAAASDGAGSLAMPHGPALSIQSDSPIRLDERWLNGQSELDYFFRPDHVYVVYQKKDIHVILIGQVLADSGGTYELRFEAGFFNGFLMPDTLIAELHGFQLPRERLESVSTMRQPVLQQASGALLLAGKPDK